MKAKLCSLVAASALILAVVDTGTAWASSVSWTFGGVVTDFDPLNNGHGAAIVPPFSDVSPAFNVGDSFSGTVTWNSDWATLFHGGNQPDLGMTFNIGGHSFVTPGLEMTRNGPPGYVQFVASADGIGTIDGHALFGIQAVLGIFGVPADIPIDPCNVRPIETPFFFISVNTNGSQDWDVAGVLTSFLKRKRHSLLPSRSSPPASA